MREIKFRAFIKEHDIVADVISIDFREKIITISDEDGVKISNDAAFFQTIFEFDDVYLMQRTGLKDKNGVEIYDGYIAKDRLGYLYSIEFLKGDFIARHEPNKSEEEYDNLSMLYDELEVIGNIYENKELLNEK